MSDGFVIADEMSDLPQLPMCVLPMLVRCDDGTYKFAGTCTIVTPDGWALTAHHVVTEMDNVVAEFGGFRAALISGQDGGGGYVGALLPVQGGGMESDQRASDVALVKLQPPMVGDRPVPLRFVAVSESGPSVGEAVSAFGYAEMTGESVVPPIDSQGYLTQSNGTVVQVLPDGRDRLVVPYPAFQLDCHMAGGMSGGPVVSEAGTIVGVCSSGPELGVSVTELASSESGSYHSYGALLTPHMDELAQVGTTFM